MYDADDGKSASRSSFSQGSSFSPGVRTPSRSSTRTSSKTVKTSNKVTERHFTPRTRQLAIASKSHIRTRIVYHESGPFYPLATRLARMEFAWTTVKEAANKSENLLIKDAFKRASYSDTTKKNLLTFVSHLLSDER
jgi:hypothetical protein